MSSEFQRVVLRNAGQWSAALALGFEPEAGGGWKLPPTPRFAGWLDDLAVDEEVDDVAGDACGRIWWIARRGEERTLRCRRSGVADDARLALADLGIRGKVRLHTAGERVWLLDVRGRRLFEIDARSRQVVGETPLGAREDDAPRDFAPSAAGVVWVLYAERAERLSPGAPRIVVQGLRDAVALDARSSGATTLLFVAEGDAPGLVRVEVHGTAVALQRLPLFSLDPAEAAPTDFGPIVRLLALGPGLSASVLALDAQGRAAVFDAGGARTAGLLAQLGALRAVARGGTGEVLAAGARRIARLALDPAAPLARGRIYVRVLDSGPSPDALWHRIDFDLDLPPGVGLELRHTFTSDAGQRAVLDGHLAADGRSAGERAMSFETALGGSLAEDEAAPWGPPQVLFGDSVGGESVLAPQRAGRSAVPPRSLLLRNDERALVRARGAPGRPLRYLWLRIDVFALPDGNTPRGRASAAPFRLRAVELVRPRLTWLRYLPAVYKEDEESRYFLERYLSAFERLFETIEDEIDHLEHDFDPARVRADRLDVLARWLGLSLDPLWNEGTRRALLGEAGALARRKGTPAAVVRQLELASGRRVRLDEAWSLPEPARLGGASTLGAVLLASPDTDAAARADAPPRGDAVPPLEAVARARAWRATAHVELPREALDARTLERIERWLRDGAPAHVDVRVAASSGGETLFRVGDALCAAPLERLGRVPLGTARLSSATAVAHLGSSRLDSGHSLGRNTTPHGAMSHAPERN